MDISIAYGVIAAAFSGCLLGGIIKGATGSGLPQIAVPVIALLTDVPTAVALVQLPAIAINIAQLRTPGYSLRDVGAYWPVALTLLVATSIGVFFLTAVAPTVLFALMGAVTLAAAAFLIFRPEASVPPRLRTPVGIGLASLAGLFSGMTALAGPFMIPYFVALRLPKNLFISVLSMCFLSTLIPTTVLFLLWRVVDPVIFGYSALAIAPAIAGMLIGAALRRRISETAFRQMVLAMLGITGVALLLKAW